MTDVAAGGVSGGAVAFVHGTYKVERYKVPGILKLAHLQTMLGNATIFSASS